MSNWSHVAGIIRIDTISRAGLDFDDLIGKECLFESPEKVWDDAEKHPDKYLPMGSEGSLQKTVWENPVPNLLDAYTISIFGDLRDHNSTKDIIEWFKEKCSKLCDIPVWISAGVITVRNEQYGTETYVYIESEVEK